MCLCCPVVVIAVFVRVCARAWIHACMCERVRSTSTYCGLRKRISSSKALWYW
jgi:hypothetical protein